MGAVGSEHAVVASEMHSRSWHQRSQSSDEIQRLEEHTRGAVRAGRLLRVAHQAAASERQALLRHRRPADGAAVRCEAEDRKRLEQLCRSTARPALSDERVQCNGAGQVVLKLKMPWRYGTTYLVMSPPLRMAIALA